MRGPPWPRIRAFIAHSFLDQDKVLIEKFLEFFDSVKKVLPDFSWEHAKDAKPISVSEKVLELMQDKNLLISICTPNELAVPPEAVTKFGFGSFVSNRSFKEKASDWIIQEIGVAIGRGMKIIVLVQNGVRTPGRLFNDLEYIEFSPQNLEECFKKLLQMLGALVPKGDAIALVAEPKPVTSDKASPDSADDENWQPKPSWNVGKYERAAFRAILTNNKDHFASIDEAFKLSPHAQEGVLLWNARIEYFRIIADQKFDFDLIKRAANDNPNNSEFQHFLAAAYRSFGEHGQPPALKSMLRSTPAMSSK